MTTTVFTSESVTRGHPDKICDIVSDAIVDAFQRNQPGSKVSAECAISKNIMFIAVHFSGGMEIDIPEVARGVIRECGYHNHDFNAEECTILTSFVALESMGVRSLKAEDLEIDDPDRIVVRNQVNQFGFACDQSPNLMPTPIWLAHELARALDYIRESGSFAGISPDCKIEVGIRYAGNQPDSVNNITLFVPLELQAENTDRLREFLIETVILPVIERTTLNIDKSGAFLVNPGVVGLTGGPSFHSGLTGRKTAIDTYGEYARNSSSALSGKDPFRADRIGAYAARYAAKNIVAAGLARQCEVHLTYIFGKPGPESISVETYGTTNYSNQQLKAAIEKLFDFRLGAIINQFHLFHAAAYPIRFKNLACYGQIGREDLNVPWEISDQIEALRAFFH